jgi:hypothetical protein
MAMVLPACRGGTASGCAGFPATAAARSSALGIDGGAHTCDPLGMRRRKSCGVFVLRGGEPPAFLLLKDGARWDVPKGKEKRGESELQCAMRELF